MPRCSSERSKYSLGLVLWGSQALSGLRKRLRSPRRNCNPVGHGFPGPRLQAFTGLGSLEASLAFNRTTINFGLENSIVQRGPVYLGNTTILSCMVFPGPPLQDFTGLGSLGASFPFDRSNCNQSRSWALHPATSSFLVLSGTRL